MQVILSSGAPALFLAQLVKGFTKESNGATGSRNNKRRRLLDETQ